MKTRTQLESEVTELKKALRHCMSVFVDADNMTTQSYQRAYEATLDGQPFNSSNVKCKSHRSV